MLIKKIILYGFVIVSFVLYSLGLRHDDSKPVVTMPKSNTTNSLSSAITTSSGGTNNTVPGYKDGKYTGVAADALYGNIQVEATISGGKITDVQFLQYPNDRRNSVEINRQAMPMLKQEAIGVQTAHVNGVSGATDTFKAFVESLSSALAKAA